MGLNSFERAMVYFFILSQFLLFLLVLSYWKVFSLTWQIAHVIFGILILFGLIQLLLLRNVFRQQREHRFVDRFNHYHLHLEPIKNIIEKKEIKLYQMSVELKNNFPKSQDELELATQKIINECFIQLNFTRDTLLNALLFKYYIIFQSRNVELKTMISHNINLDQQKRIEFYELIEFGFEQMMWIIGYNSSQEDIERRNLTKLEREGLLNTYRPSQSNMKKITLIILKEGSKINYTCSYEGGVKNIIQVAQYLDRQKKKNYLWFWEQKRIQFELGPKSVLIKSMMKI